VADVLARRDEIAGSVVPAAKSLGRYDIVAERREEDIARRLARTSAQATVFQAEGWLRAWYATIGRTSGTPLLITANERRTGALAAMLPLVARRDGALRVIEFADCDVSDSNAPILGPAAPQDAVGARAMWREMRAALMDADLVRFTKMPAEIEERANPLALLSSARPSPLNGNTVTIEGSFDDYLATLKGMLRKQLRKHWRLFAQHDGATFRRIDAPDEALNILATLERQQGARLRAQGQPYRLDEPAFSEFYRAVTAEGVADGSVILTALTHHDEVVAALLGLARGDTYVMIRICTGTDRWSQCSPGKLVIVKTMQALHAEGFRVFDFSVGDYDYKRRLGARGEPLFELTEALSARGLPALAYNRAKQFVRQRPALLSVARRVMKRPQKGAAGDDRD
jgi:CelD/BcsL family acetyltransferase involved in cellulose biosynthesis